MLEMAENQVKERIDSLRKELNEHNHKYYVESTPVISDFDFDMLLNELIELENNNPEYSDPNSPTQRVGGDITTSFF